MRNAIKSLFTMKFIGILIIIQFSIGLYLINTSSITQEEAINKKNNLERIFFDPNNTYLLRVVTYKDDDEEFFNPTKNYPKVKKVYDELLNLKKEGIVKNNFLWQGGGRNGIASRERYKDVLPEKYHNMDEPELAKYASQINLNEEFYNSYKLNITDGRGFNKEDFNVKGLEENIPVIIGEDFKGFVKIGDTFDSKIPDLSKEDTSAFNEITYEVIGFYKHNDIPILGDMGRFLSEMYYSDALVLMPIISDSTWFDEGTTIAQYGIWVNVENSQYLEKVKERINSVIKDDDFSISIEDVKNEYKTIETMIIEKANNSIILGYALTILSIIGISAIMVGRINNRKKEFGVKIACGATTQNIIYEIIIENAIMCSIASIISLISIYINYRDYLSIDTIVKNLIITVFIILLVNILPIIKIKRLNVTDLVKGD